MSAVMDSTVKWPQLSTVPYVSGRPATKHDIATGGAAFLIGSDEVSQGVPIDIAIPQYAFHRAEGTNALTPVVVVQAERSWNAEMAGLLDVRTGKHMVSFLWELQLLGVHPPTSD